MAVQTTYGFQNSPLLPGMRATLNEKDDITGFASAAIPFGVGLFFTGVVDVAGSSTNNVLSLDNFYDRREVELPSPGTALIRFAGVAMFDHTQPISGEVDPLETLASTQLSQYAIGAPIKICKKGRVAVLVDPGQVVSDSTPVFVRHTVNAAGTARGYFRIDADTARAVDLSTVARWASPAINIDNYRVALLDLDVV